MSTAMPTSVGELEPLVPVALGGLAWMQDQRTGLFSHKTFIAPGGEPVNAGTNPLYSGACVIGLLSLGESGPRSHSGQARRALDALLTRPRESDPAVLGVALWGCVLAGDAGAEHVAARLIEVMEPQGASSMQLGLALTGLARWLRAGGDSGAGAGAAAAALAAELRRRYMSGANLFAGTGHRRGRHPALALMTSFASQVYPVLALCELAVATGTAPPPEVARVCDQLVALQGERGQWWWFYSTRSRKVIEGYPVYSVHQDAMAAMALLPATRLGLGDYRSAVAAGVRWVTGNNELGRTLVDERQPLIHRAIQRAGGDADGLAGWSRRQRAAAYVAAIADRPRRRPRHLEVLRECRSYHLGWLLLAAAMARDLG